MTGLGSAEIQCTKSKASKEFCISERFPGCLIKYFQLYFIPPLPWHGLKSMAKDKVFLSEMGYLIIAMTAQQKGNQQHSKSQTNPAPHLFRL